MNRFAELDVTGNVIGPASQAVVARLDLKTGLMWGPTLPKAMEWAEAKAACADFRLFGFSDWVLPEVDVLFGLALRTRINPAIDVDAFPDTKPRAYWSATTWAEAPSRSAWYVGFGDGNSDIDGQKCRLLVRPCRIHKP